MISYTGLEFAGSSWVRFTHGTGGDNIRGGKGADILIGGEGTDIFEAPGH